MGQRGRARTRAQQKMIAKWEFYTFVFEGQGDVTPSTTDPRITDSITTEADVVALVKLLGGL